jgi:hypothetical protein
LQRAFGETYSDWSSLGRDFRCDAEQEDGDLMLGDGGEEEENFSLFDFRFSLSDSVDGRLEMLGHPPWGGGALGSLALVR